MADLVGTQQRPARTGGEPRGERALPAAGQTADEDGHRTGLAQVMERQSVQLAGCGDGLLVSLDSLLSAEARHFRPHVGPLRDGVVQEGLRKPITGPLLVHADELGGQVDTAQTFEVHGQEGHVGTDVPIAERIGELNAVDDADAVVEAEDILGLQVAMSVAHPTRRNTCVEQGAMAMQPTPSQHADPRIDLGVEHRTDERRRFMEVHLPCGLEGLGRR